MPNHEADLETRARAWLKDDPDPATRRELEGLLEKRDQPAIEDRFGAKLVFGTAGLRGLLGAGPNRMNRAVVLRATAGLAAWVKAQVPGAQERGVAIGFDGRRMSREFADDAARVLLGAGFRVHAYSTVVATPVLAFTVLDRKAAAGIMITASHNPPEYNGYKVYWENGAQIIPPNDVGIAEAIDAVELAKLPLADGDVTKHPRYAALGEDVIDRYHAGVQKLVRSRDAKRNVRIAYTALHGVGERFTQRALAEAGFGDVHSVAAQAKPDGAFPTVSFPNPEEEGAMDLVLALATDKDADLVLANDPDADRLAVAVKAPNGRYTMLTGNEIGCLLAHYLLSAVPPASAGQNDGRVVVSTVVSSPMLGAIAKAHGATWEQTLTGFKWIANRAMDLERAGRSFVFGYEEALGYSVGTLVRDKDGVSAATVMADMAAWCQSQGRTLLDEREVMWRKYGLFLSKQVSLVRPGMEGLREIAAMMDRARANPPAKVGTLAVTEITDLEKRERRTGNKVERLDGPTSDVLVYALEGGHRVMLRPSGTEPKLKLYHDVHIAIAEGEPVTEALARGEKFLTDLAVAFRSQIAHE